MSVNRNIVRELGLLQMQILWILSKREAHGYFLMELLSRIKHSPVTQGTLYPALAKLERPRLVAFRKEGTRGKKLFHLTAKGRTIAEETCREFISTYQDIFYDFTCSSCKGHCHAPIHPIIIEKQSLK